jgi:prepilin-type N-terminal cleavage/methylation domain-containing protein
MIPVTSALPLRMQRTHRGSGGHRVKEGTPANPDPLHWSVRDAVHTAGPAIPGQAPFVGTAGSLPTPATVCVPMQYRSHGFTLVELMVALTIAAIILSFAVPSFRTFRQNNRLTAVANDLLGAMQTARTEAIKRQLPVSVCPTADPEAATPTCVDGEYRSWIAFIDVDSNCERTAALLPGGTAETDPANLVRVGGPIEDPLVARSDGTCVSFAATGFVQPTGKDTAGFTFFWDQDFPSPRCGEQPGAPEQSRARAIEVTNTGRSRITRHHAEVTAALAAAGVACP